MTQNVSQVSRSTLERVPPRTLTFLTAAGTNLGIRSILENAGYTPEVHRTGCALLAKVAGFPDGKADMNLKDAKVVAAYAEIDANDEPFFRRTKAALDHHHPEQSRFVFESIEPAQGPESVVRTSIVLDRLNQLAAGRSDATREADQAAIATLATRGIGEGKRAHLAELVGIAQSIEKTTPTLTTSDLAAKRDEALLELAAWYADWSETARVVITRRDHLISLGLAKRRSKKSVEPVPPTPA